MLKITKITASVGPKSESHAVLTKMVRAGANLFRINFSHDTGDTQGAKIDTIRTVARELKTPVAIIVDLQGPKHRIGNFATEDKYKLTIGQRFTFDTNETPGDNTRVCLPHPEVIASLRVGDRILLNDGKLECVLINANQQKSSQPLCVEMKSGRVADLICQILLLIQMC